MADPLRNSIATNNCNASKGDRNMDPGRCELFHERFTSGNKRKNQEKKKTEEHGKQTQKATQRKKGGR
jgi:hypothetical protein